LRQLTCRDFLQNGLNAQKPKDCHTHAIAQFKPSTKWLLPLSFSEGKLRGTSFTASGDLNFAIRQISSEILQMVLKNVFTNWITTLYWMMKQVGEKIPDPGLSQSRQII
jgi:hypothetical protein